MSRDSQSRSGLMWRTLIPLATLVLGFVLGLYLAPARDAPITTRDGRLVAGGTLEELLSTQVGTGSPGPTRIAQTFRTRAGVVCRSFISEEAPRGFAGIACRDGDLWRIAMLTPAQRARDSSDAELPSLLRDGIAALAGGNPLDGDEERAARVRGWR